MNTKSKRAFWWSFASMGIGLLTPSLIIFCLEIVVGGIEPLTSIAGIFRRQFAEGHNLFLIAVFGLIPFAAHSIVCFVAARHLNPARLACVAIGGLVGILGLMVPGHISVWYPLYGPGRASSTAVIAFFFIPIYCSVTLSVGLFIVWIISLLPYFRRNG